MSQVFALLSSVEMLTGAENYDNWKNQISDILTLVTADSYHYNALEVVQGEWVISGIPHSVAADSTLSASQISENNELYKERQEKDRLSKMAIAIINSRVTRGLVSTRYMFAHELWTFLENTYGVAGPSAIYALYMQTTNFRISGNKEPSAEIANLEMIYNRLSSCQVEIPALVRAMTLLGAIPEHWKIASSFLAAKGSVSDVSYQAVRAAILQEYTQRQSSHAHSANRFSGVKTSGNKPQWQHFNKGPQQQQRPYNGQQQQQQQQRPQGQQQNWNNNQNPGPKKQTRRGKKKPQQVNEVHMSTGIISLNHDDYSAQSSTLFANHATAQASGFASVATSAPPRQVERSLHTRISHDPRPRPYPTPYEAAKIRAVQKWDDRMSARSNSETSTIPNDLLRDLMLQKQWDEEERLREATQNFEAMQYERRWMEEAFRQQKEKQEKEDMLVDPVDEAILQEAPKKFDLDAVSLGSEPNEVPIENNKYVSRSETIDDITAKFIQAGNVSYNTNVVRDISSTPAVINTFASCFASISEEDDDSQSSDQENKQTISPQRFGHQHNGIPCEFCGILPADKDNYPIRWLLDSGATWHFTNSLDDFIEYEVGNFGHVGTAEAGKLLPITAIGTIMIEHLVYDEGSQTLIPKKSTIFNVKYAEEMYGRILSANSFARDGVTIVGKANYTNLYDENGELAMTAQLVEEYTRLHYVFSNVVHVQDMAVRTVRSISHDTWHQRFAHASDIVLSKLPMCSNPQITLPYKREDEHVCPGCALGKQTQKPFHPNPKRATKIGELTHSDLLEMPSLSYHKFKWIMTFLDDYSSAASIVLLRNKTEATKHLKSYVTKIEASNNVKCQRFRTDNGGEYMSNELKDFLIERGIVHETTTPYAHQQNGRAERLNRTLLEKSQAIRLHACVPESFWDYATITTVHVYNRTPMRRIEWKTPFEMFEGRKPNMNHLRIFGCGAYVYIPEEKRTNKLVPRSEYMTFMGYSGSGDYIFLRHKHNRSIFRSTKAIFDEGYFPFCKAEDQGRNPIKPPSTDDSDESDDSIEFPDPELHSDDPYKYLEYSQYPQAPKRLPPSSPSERRGILRGPTPSPTRSGGHTPSSDDKLSYKSATDKGSIPTLDSEYKPEVKEYEPLPLRTPSETEEGEIKSPPPSPPRRFTPQEKGKQPEIRSESESEIDLPEKPPLRRSTRIRQPPLRSGNTYGDRIDPVAIEKQIEKEQKTRPLSRKIPGPKWTPTEDQIERDLAVFGKNKALPNTPETEDQHLKRLVSEGGKEFINFLMANAITPVTYRDLDKIPQDDQKAWIDACMEELRALKKRDVYSIVDLPQGRKAIKNRWVFNIKSDGRKRARLVAKGFSQIEGIDFDELFSPVVRYETARLIFGVAALEDWEIESVDVKAAYLYGKLDEEIYMEQPEGFKTILKHKVWKLHRALYGLKQSGLAWWRELTASMKELGFKRCASDAGVYYYIDQGTKQLIIALVYVDDVAIIGQKTKLYIDLKNKFMIKWECRDLGETKEFLGMKIQRDRKRRLIFIDQADYLEKILNKFEVDSKPTKTPLSSGFSFNPNSGLATPSFRQKYQQLVGSIMYLMIGSRPDIAFATVKLSQQCANPAQEHYDQGLHVLRYLLGSRRYRLKFDGKSNEAIVAYSDSDWGQDPINRKSVTGNYVTLATGCVSWLSRRQKTVASSSTEAEYMALSDCSRQLVWMHQLLSEIGFKIPPPYLNADNEGSIFWGSNPVQEKRSKHIDIRYHVVREYVEEKKIVLLHIAGDVNPADIFTKNLDRTKFEQIRSLLGMEFFQ